MDKKKIKNELIVEANYWDSQWYLLVYIFYTCKVHFIGGWGWHLSLSIFVKNKFYH
jgi:hypothetical protein